MAKSIPETVRPFLRIPPCYSTGLAQFSAMFSRYWRTWFAQMQRGMMALRHYLQVFHTVIFFVSIDMMHLFPAFQKAAQGLFHNKTMLKNIMLLSTRMIRSIHPNITKPIPPSASLPERMAFTFKRYVSWRQRTSVAMNKTIRIPYINIPPRTAITGDLCFSTASAFADTRRRMPIWRGD